MLLEWKAEHRNRKTEKNYSKNVVQGRVLLQTSPAFPTSFLTVMSRYTAWVNSKQESKNFQLAELKSVGTCEEIDLTHCGCHLHLSTISSRRSGRRGRAVALYHPLLTTRQIGRLAVWFSTFLLGEPNCLGRQKIAAWVRRECAHASKLRPAAMFWCPPSPVKSSEKVVHALNDTQNYIQKLYWSYHYMTWLQ